MPIEMIARLGSARPMFDDVDGEERSLVQVPERDAERESR